MKKRSFFSLILSFAIFAVIGIACSKTATKVNPQEEFLNTLTAADTTEILKLSNTFMETLQQGKVDEAISTLVLLDTANNVQDLPVSVKESLKNNFRLLPVRSFTVQGYEFQKNDSNYVSYSYVAIPATETEPEVTMGFKTKPVKVDGKWYLTLPDYSNLNKSKVEE